MDVFIRTFCGNQNFIEKIVKHILKMKTGLLCCPVTFDCVSLRVARTLQNAIHTLSLGNVTLENIASFNLNQLH